MRQADIGLKILKEMIGLRLKESYEKLIALLSHFTRESDGALVCMQTFLGQLRRARTCLKRRRCHTAVVGDAVVDCSTSGALDRFGILGCSGGSFGK